MDKYKEVINLFIEKAEMLKDEPAVIFHEQVLSYAELDELTAKCADFLNRIYTKEEKLIPFVMPRTPALLVLIGGIMKSGRAFLPIDYSFPRQRIEYICKDCGINKLICDAEQVSKMRTAFENIDLIGFDLDVIGKENNRSLEPVYNDIAYVLYTSGSTGNPKGVVIGKNALDSFINAISTELTLTECKKILATASVSFDMSILELVVPLLKGMSIVLADEHEQKNPRLLRNLIEKTKVEIIQLTPSLLNLLLLEYEDRSFLENVQDILIGGETLPASLLAMLVNSCQGRLYNMYGPTESTVWCSLKRLSRETKITIGNPLPGNEIYIIDEEGKLLPEGMAGEICIGGKQLAQGYLNNRSLTSTKFTPNPFKSGEIMYRTGDGGRLSADKEVEFLGRLDNQVKINGYRIELEEIENILMKNNRIKQAVVVAKKTDEIYRNLCAYIISEDVFEESTLRHSLAAYLPEYMLPLNYIRLDKFPLTKNGKIDRRALEEHQVAAVKTGNSSQETEQDSLTLKVKECIRSCSGKDLNPLDIKNDSPLKDLGIGSINMVRVIMALENGFGFVFTDEDFYENSFILLQDIIDFIRKKINDKQPEHITN